LRDASLLDCTLAHEHGLPSIFQRFRTRAADEIELQFVNFVDLRRATCALLLGHSLRAG
jgi:hypothetical protein